MLAHVHFEPNSTLGELRVKLHAVHAHCPVYPAGWAFVTGDFNICDPEEGRFCVASQTLLRWPPVVCSLMHWKIA